MTENPSPAGQRPDLSWIDELEATPAAVPPPYDSQVKSHLRVGEGDRVSHLTIRDSGPDEVELTAVGGGTGAVTVTTMSIAEQQALCSALYACGSRKPGR